MNGDSFLLASYPQFSLFSYLIPNPSKNSFTYLFIYLFIVCLFVCLLACFLFFETGFHCVALAVLELTL